MIDRVRDLARIGANIGVRLDVGAGCDFAFEPGGKGRLFSDVAGGADTRDESGGVVAFGIGEVIEVEGGFDSGVGRGEVELAFALGAGDVGRHAEGVDRGVVAEAGGVEAEGDLVAVHHDVGDARGVVAGPGEEDAGVRVHGGLIGGYGPVELPHDDAFRVVEEVVADSWDGGDDGDVEGR